MEESRAAPSRQHPYGNSSATMQRRFSFSSQATAAIGKANSPSKSPRKASSFPSMNVQDNSPGSWSDLRAQQEEAQQQEATSAAETSAPQDPATEVDVSLILDIKGSSGHFSDDDSDGSVYSSVCSNDENSPTPSSSSMTSSSPLLRRPPAAGFEELHSQASDPSSLDSVSRQDELQGSGALAQFSLDVPPATGSPRQSNHLAQQRADESLGDDDDLPDWLHERIVLSPAASMTKMSVRSPQQIEDEIRFAVDSAAARVQQALGRREQFQSDLQSAATYGPVYAAGSNQPAVSSLRPGGGDDVERLLNRADNLVMVYHEQEVLERAAHDMVPKESSQGGQGDLLLLMEVVIGDGRTETIEIYEGDNPDLLASAFAEKHALLPDAVPKLSSLIQEQFDTFTEAEPEEIIPGGQTVDQEWAREAAADGFASSCSNPSTLGPKATERSRVVSTRPGQPEQISMPQQTHEREHTREYSYNNLMARYGHYSQHSGRVDPEGVGSHRSAPTGTSGSHSMQAMERARATERLSASSAAPAFTTLIHSSRSTTSRKKTNLADAPAYERLHALAESKDKWIQRAQKAKELEKAREEERMHHVELMAAKSRELVANRTNGGYAHIGERLHDEALSDISKKMQRHERRVAEREQQQDWMCPKCAYVNQHTDPRCQNIVALVSHARRGARSPTASSSGRRETASSANSSFGFLESHPEVLCGQPKPERLFQPTLLTAVAGVMKAVSANKDKSSRVASLRRQRHQHAIQEEFQQTCPFRPKINNVSEEIVREKLETAAAAAAVHGETRRPRNPHLELYENSFQTRAQREEREEEYFKQFPFKPDIGVNALWVAPDKSQSDFVERLAVDKYHELERKRVALHDKYAPDRDPHTGKEFFKPEIGRAPAFSRNKQGLPIGDFLHAAHREQQEYHRRLREKDQREIKKKSQQTFVSEASRQALERRKADTCSRIFEALLTLSRPPATEAARPELATTEPPSQQDECGESVTPSQVKLSELPAEISRVVAIVFEYANHEPIARDAFSKYMDRLVREVAGVTYSHIIFLAEHLHTDRGGRHRHQQHHSDPEREAALAAAEQKELTFHPAIDKNSREIATKHGRVSSAKVFHALNQYYDHYLERKEQLRKQQQREFKRSHPFRPTLVTRAHQREPAAAAFYDKIRMGNSEDSGTTVMWGATASVSSAPTSHRNAGASAPPPAPLQTALSNARPCVRPIESERRRFYTSATMDDAPLEEPAGNMSRSSSSSQLLEDAELTSRVLAALDEKPVSASLSPASSYQLTKALSSSDIFTSQASKETTLRSPEDATPSPANYEFTDM